MAKPVTRSIGNAKLAAVRKRAVAKAAKKAGPAKKKAIGMTKKATKQVKKAVKSTKPKPTKKAVKKVVKPIVQASSSTDEGPLCSICQEDLSCKRSFKFHPCGHSFHRTCGLEWMETRDYKWEQTCPNCRYKVEHIEENGEPVYYCWRRQPTILQVLRRLRDGQTGEDLKDFVMRLHAESKKELIALRSHHRTAIQNKMSTLYVEDCEKELSMVEERVKHYEDMVHIFDDDTSDTETSRYLAPMRGMPS